MNCNSNHSLFLRSNGVLACWDDAGSAKELQPFDPGINYARDVYLGPVYEEIRTSLRSGRMPFVEHCSKCFCLMSHMGIDDGAYVRERRIETFQIEPSMGCQLECPGCIPRVERKGRVRKTPQGQLTLDPQVLYKIVDDLHGAGIHVDKFDMQGHGEPLLHKRVWEMCGYIAERFPRSIVSICTHANAEFRPEMVHSGVNEMFFAIDGVDQNSYAPYRVHGLFDRAYGFMRDFSRLAADEAPHIDRVWKYVVFSHNDSDDQLLRAQELALEAKVTKLRLVLTQLGPTSSRIMEREDVPVLDPSLHIVVDNYKIRLEQLQSALEGLKTATWRLNLAEAKSWSEFMAYSVYRLFRTADVVPSGFTAVIEEFRETLSRLPADDFARYDTLAGDATRRVAPRKASPGSKRDREMRRAAPPRACDLTVEACRTLLDSVVVDERWYLHTYPDVREAVASGGITDAASHYRQWGFYEERLPYAPKVDEEFYFETYPDVLTAYERGDIHDATDHYVRSGYREGRLAMSAEAADLLASSVEAAVGAEEQSPDVADVAITAKPRLVVVHSPGRGRSAARAD